MGATNTTANYNLSQFIGTDKPAWLQDYNGDMLKIDTGINAAKVAADGAQNSASAAQNDATTANNAITNTINPAISSLNTTVGNQGGAINTINSLIGNGTPTTTDQTIIGAINEINAAITPITLTLADSHVSTVRSAILSSDLPDGDYIFSNGTLNKSGSSFSLIQQNIASDGKLTICMMSANNCSRAWISTGNPANVECLSLSGSDSVSIPTTWILHKQ